MFPQAEESPDDVDYPLTDLWGDWDRTYMFMDYFEEMQSQMEEGETPITCLLCPDDELGLTTDCDTMDPITCLLRPDDELGLKTNCDTTDPSDDENGLFDVLASEIDSIL